MTSIATENLEERIERIRKRTEEIEKKHRAAEEDRLMALMDNAMVKTKPPKDEDWPKAHKYDKLDFTYDIKPEKLEENVEQKQQSIKPKRDYKKFADGEGPPPDPIYNFLADAERDGNILQQKEQIQKNYDRKDLKQNQLNSNGNNNGRNIDNNNKIKDQFNKRGGIGSANGQQNNNNNSFRNRGGSSGISGNNNINGKTQQNNRYQKQQNLQSENQKQNLHPEQWRSEKIDDNNKLNNRQKINNAGSNGGNNCEKWRRGADWDNNDIKADKNNSNDNNKSPKHNNNNNNANKNYYQHHHNQHQNYHQQNITNNIYTPVENIIEKRGNIMVSVSPGEVKSVKLTSAQVIGSGRVGPRQVTKPQFHIQTMEKEQLQQQQQQQTQNITVPISPRPQINSGHQQQLNKLNNFNNQQQQNNQIHNNYQQYATKNTIPPTHRQQQTTIQPQLNINTNNNGISLSPKSPVKDTKNSKSTKYIPPQQQKPILPNLMSIVVGGDGTDDTILKSPIIANNLVNNIINVTANTNNDGAGVATISGQIQSVVDITVPEIDVKVLAVAKELSNKPEFAKKSVQDRLLRIRQMSQPEVISSQPILTCDIGDNTTSNNNNIVDQLININDNLNATLLIKDANKDEQIDSIKNIETFVACN